jgi:uncharacterized protein (TIGR00297 family)
VLGAGAAGAVAVAGWWRGALTADGAAAAVAVGTPVFAVGGGRWAAVLVGFFTLSSALSQVGRERKAAMAAVASKGSRRDAGQVLANGGVAAGAAVVAGITGKPEAAFPAFLGAMAAATSDTWATEIGLLSRRPPRSIVTWRQVRPGLSGGVTPLGLAAAAAGGATIGLIGSLGRPRRELVALGTLAGLAGSLADSVAGATVQGVYRCPRCGEETERRVHSCGTPTIPARGVAWIDNDMVNLIGSAVGAITALVLARRRPGRRG